MSLNYCYSLMVCVSDENVHDMAGELVQFGLISEVGVLCLKRLTLYVHVCMFVAGQICVGDTDP